jgi:hypothetical protein
MRKLIAAIMAVGAAAFAGPVMAADMPLYPPVIDIPDVDYGVTGSFYLRGSVAGNLLWSQEAYAWECAPCGALTQTTFPFVDKGYGYSVGGGFGYETGSGLRFDATVDYLSNDGLKVTKGAAYGARQGDYTVKLRSTLALANVYYDVSFGGSDPYGYGYSAAGGAFGYVGAGAGLAFKPHRRDLAGRRGRALGQQYQLRRRRYGRRRLRLRCCRCRYRLPRRLHQRAEQLGRLAQYRVVQQQLGPRSARHAALPLQLSGSASVKRASLGAPFFRARWTGPPRHDSLPEGRG